MEHTKEIEHRFNNVSGSVSIDELKIVSVSKPKYASVELCIKADCNIPFAKIKLYSRDRYIDAEYCFKSAVSLGKEIESRYNSQPALLAVLKRIADECFEAMEGAGLPEFENYGCWMNIAKQAVAEKQ